jgi:lysophospholipase
MKRGALLLAVLSAACRSPSPLAKQTAFDFDAQPGPAPTEFSAEATLLARWNDSGANSLKAFWNSGEPGTFKGVDGVPIVYRIHQAANAKAGIVIVPGRTEAIVKYAEVAQDLVAQGYSTYLVTLRGQGEAGRMLPDPSKGYVAWFDDYVQDTHTFISTVVKPKQSRVFLVAHSLGGAAAATLVDEFPTDIDAMALSAPMFEIDLGGFPPPVAASLAAGVCNATDGSGYSVGSGPYQEETDFSSNTVTHSQARWQWKVQQLRDDESIRLGGVTWRWLCQSLVASSRAEGLGKFSSIPTVVFQAGTDVIVKPAGQNRYCADAPACTLSRIEGASHELLQETDEWRNVVLSRMVKFFDAQVMP